MDLRRRSFTCPLDSTEYSECPKQGLQRVWASASWKFGIRQGNSFVWSELLLMSLQSLWVLVVESGYYFLRIFHWVIKKCNNTQTVFAVLIAFSVWFVLGSVVGKSVHKDFCTYYLFNFQTLWGEQKGYCHLCLTDEDAKIEVKKPAPNDRASNG